MVPIIMAMLPLLGFKVALPLFGLSISPADLLNGGASQQCGLLSGNIANTIATQEPWYCPISNQVTNQWESWLPVMLIVTIISFLIAAIIFMAGVFLSSAKIRSYGVAEFYEAIATAIIVVAFVYVCAVLFGLGPGMLVANINPYSTAFSLLGSTLASAQNMYFNLYRLYFSYAAKTSATITLPGIGAGVRSFSRLASGASVIGMATATFMNIYTYIITIFFLDPANALGNILLQGMAVLYAEYYLLVFFSAAAIPAFLIPGIIFRALLPTRGLGGVMIAMAIGFYLVMPALFATVYFFTAPGMIRGMNLASAQMRGVAITGEGAVITSPQSPAVVQFANAQQSLSGFWMLILFYPVMIIAFTYSFIVELSKLIGGTYQRTAMGRLRRFI